MSDNSPMRIGRNIDAGLATVRIVAGLILMLHGWQKIFVYGFPGVSDSFDKMGVPMAGVMGPFISLLEFAGGVMLIVGLFSRVVGLLLAADMLGAILLVHLSAGFFAPQGYEFALALLAMTLTVYLAGPGEYSADAWRSRRHITDSHGTVASARISHAQLRESTR